MRPRSFLALVVMAGVFSLGCSLRKSEPDTKVAYTDPLDESWYQEPNEDVQSSAPPSTAQARPLPGFESTTDSSSKSFSPAPGGTPPQDPDWDSPVGSPTEGKSALPSWGNEQSDSPAAIVGAPVVGNNAGGGAVPRTQSPALVASRPEVATDAGDSFFSGNSSTDMPSSGLRLDVSPPPPSLPGGNLPGGGSAITGSPIASPGSPSGTGLTNPASGLELNATGDGSLSRPPRVPDPGTSVSLPGMAGTASSTPVDPTFDDGSAVTSPVFSAPSSGVIPPAPIRSGAAPGSNLAQENAANRGASSASTSAAEPAPNAEVLKNQAVDAYKKGRFSESTRLFRQFQTAYPDQSTDWVQWHLAQSLLEEGRWGESGDEFRKLVGSRNRELRAEALLKLGIIDAKRGNFEIAQNRWDRILTEYPDTKAAKRATEELAKNRP